MKLTIIPADKAVYVNGHSISGFSFNSPANVHALQWLETEGHIEFLTVNYVKPQNELITELPSWAIDAVAAYEVEKNRLHEQAIIDAQNQVTVETIATVASAST
jgi:hypothetical protein